MTQEPTPPAPPSAQQIPTTPAEKPRSWLLEGKNKFLLILLICLFLFIIFELVSLFYQKRRTELKTTPTKKAEIFPGVANTNINANQVFFDELQQEGNSKGAVSTTKRYEGKVLTLIYSDQGEALLELTISDIATFFDNNHKPIVTTMKLQYPRAVANRIKVGYVTGVRTNSVTLEEITDTIKEGDTIIIEEQLDPQENSYEKALKEVKITKI